MAVRGRLILDTSPQSLVRHHLLTAWIHTDFAEMFYVSVQPVDCARTKVRIIVVPTFDWNKSMFDA